MQAKHAQQHIADFQQQYPHALKWTFLSYSHLKTKGILDDYKGLIPWVLAAMIFIPICFVIQENLIKLYPNMMLFDAFAYASLSILLFFMLYIPYALKQIKHSSNSLYPMLRHEPVKIAALIVLQALNFAFVQSLFLMWVLTFLGLSFGFVRFYKENLFKDHATSDQQYQLQQIRKACYWAYKQTVLLRMQLRLIKSSSPRYAVKKSQLQQFADLHTELFKLEHDVCKSIKYIDIDSYLDDKL